MKILIVMRSVNHFLYYRSIVGALASRGHSIDVLFDKGWSAGYNEEPVQAFIEEHPNVQRDWSLRRVGLWRSILFPLRELRTYRRFLLVPGQSTYYRDRWPNYMPWFLRQMVKRFPGAKAFLKTAFCGRMLSAIENGASLASNIVRDIKNRKPDVVIVLPLNMRFSEEIEYLKAAKSLSIPTASAVISWDNLTTKGLIHVRPDIEIVWNDAQVKEARIHHGITETETRIVGSAVFDQWFDSSLGPSMSRDEFCKVHHLNPEHPFFLYLGSSRNMATDETWIIKKLRAELDGSTDSRLQNASLAVRPHGANYAIYEEIEEKGITLVPRVGTLPNTKESFQLFYDTVFHSSGVIVGVNTSAVIDAMTVGKPLVVCVTEQYKKTQAETQHFQQLVEMGAVYLAHDEGEMQKTLGMMLSGDDPKKENRTAFIKRFIRPSEVSAGEKAADEIEKLVDARHS